MRLRALAFGICLALPLSAAAADAAEPDCTAQVFEGARYSVCTAGADDDLRLFHSDGNGRLFGGFPAVNRALKAEGLKLAFATNAGMYHEDRRPVGLFIENGREISPAADGGGFGNFGLTPNGVFCIEPGRLSVIETQAYRADPPACTYATQSGPMLVIDGALHPKLLPESDSLLLRNGVGVSEDGQRAWFAMADDPVNFHSFARFFRDRLGLKNALFFDGKVSRIWAPELNRYDSGLALGVILGKVVPEEAPLSN
ncbi:hypothetical protein PSA7680_03443 [Pseudoruegeria aquimaris]|uniref:Phosphodiester glycosidase domain-containing protein n=1 Tax=Pseudoruegeria aquimaris TaxID=393663 RepID=A0A1Y5TJ45_9RHOB|nr:phosphodiester glycosidase family protein [Pseudoruegeria aquimaris]SLN65163.1 hypothetical protein PSA7680_03443 [Pseudoruegeria aquimaris]